MLLVTLNFQAILQGLNPINLSLVKPGKTKKQILSSISLLKKFSTLLTKNKRNKQATLNKTSRNSPKRPKTYLWEVIFLFILDVKFIAELIKIKLIHKKIIKYCVSLLIKEFIDGFYNFHKKNLKELNFYEYNFEALIEFLENLGDKYESIDEKTEKGKKVEE